MVPVKLVLSIMKNDVLLVDKAHFVVAGHQDSMEHYNVHRSQNIQPATTALVIALAAARCLEIWTDDVWQAYLQSDENMTRPIYTKNAATKFELSSEQALSLTKLPFTLSNIKTMS